MSKIALLKKWIDESEHIVFFGGAGVSTESGIPDFRGVDGLYHQKFEYPPEHIISRSFYKEDPAYFFRFYKERMLPLGFEPNIAHETLARWESQGKRVTVVTQNIDGLHQKAGSTRVLELHGSIHRNYCEKCGRIYPGEFVRDSYGIPTCACGGTVRPDIVLYEESLHGVTIDASLDAIADADLLIVAGTSLTVYPAAGLIRYYCGDRMVLINKDATSFDERANLVFHDRLGEVFSQL